MPTPSQTTSVAETASAPTTPRSGFVAAILTILVAAAAVWAAQQGLNSYLVTLLALLFINAALAVSLTLTNGLTGLFSLGHPAFMTIGAYVAAILTFSARRKGSMLPGLPDWLASTELSMFPALLIAGLAGGLVALAIGWAVLRLKGHYLAVATLGLIIVVQGLATNWDGITRGGAGLSGLPRHVDIWWALGFLVIVVAITWRVKFSSLGRAMMAVRENELAASCSGINAARLKILAFVIGAVMAAIAGAMLAHLISVVTPKTYSVLLAFNIVVMVVIGGSGSITGALVAATAITVLSEALRPVEESIGLYGMSQVIVALCLIVVLYLKPGGLFGSGEPAFVRRLFSGRKTQ
ncbi:MULTISPECIES: branched-chain amino acid ABC transporter permease [Nitratireductor]|uniref:branched-chain amino acid ABC transporter permease n=1 Tax=Nitratireductor TaxID=245876 RepID=UPI0019D408E0|nr:MULTISPECIES: branched-chain amino acid ABC transporter permease [Nitratireductor]MBN7760518.1 branched-chain amino acid ABC transporter permease [Nitratireductor aquibiodomus]MBN7776395.1 branched-chain amino acid ABC transporter permease [Nitratireductor pacificus]MBN7779262.1 branched-chain amino acid ABC transporter permease [Nitratireductor pacificus]MBN7788069.1 branched-chain amino acid ABC transporter permease [Nitratireductor aquimarinus]MBY6098116.1 branched-chain amino acid ABC t